LTWVPTYAATDIRAIVENLLTALAWASPSPTLTAFTKFYRNAQVWEEVDFPHFGIVKRLVATDDSDDGLRVEYQLIWEIEIKATYAEANKVTALNQIQKDLDNYAYAVESMFLNIPGATLFTNINGARHGYRSVTKSDPLERAITDTEAVFAVQQSAVMRFTEIPINQ
jgi:hypothetical protein